MKYDRSSRICQNCKKHKNKPSRCTALNIFVNRKAAACHDYVNKWGKTEVADAD